MGFHDEPVRDHLDAYYDWNRDGVLDLYEQYRRTDDMLALLESPEQDDEYDSEEESRYDD